MSGSPDAAPTPVKALGADTPPKVGDRVKVTVEGTLVGYTSAGRVLHVGNSSHYYTLPSDLAFIPGGSVSVEVLTPPAPTWISGDVILRDPDDAQIRHTATFIGGDKWVAVYPWQDRPAVLTTARTLGAPHIVLVRGGKPVVQP